MTNHVKIWSGSNVHVRNMTGVVRHAGTYFDAHPKRQSAFKTVIDDLQPEYSKTKLGDLCRTRWVQRFDALDTFQEFHPSVVACMEKIGDAGPKNWSTDSLTDAKGLLLSMTSTDFICVLVVTNKCLGYISALTSSLQAEAKDVVVAVKQVKNVVTILNDLRNKVNDHLAEWFEEVDAMCKRVNVVPSIPRRCGRQRHRDNTPAEDPDTYTTGGQSPYVWWTTCSQRWSKDLHPTRKLLCLAFHWYPLLWSPYHSLRWREPGQTSARPSTKAISLLQPVSAARSTVGGSSGRHSCRSVEKLAFQHHRSKLFHMHQTSILISMSCCWSCVHYPSQHAPVRGSFSSLKRIKTYLRSKCGNERLTSLALMHIHRDVSVHIYRDVSVCSHPQGCVCLFTSTGMCLSVHIHRDVSVCSQPQGCVCLFTSTGMCLSVHIHRDVPVCSHDVVDIFARLHPRRLELCSMK